MEFAWAVRQEILRSRPAAVAVELPATLEGPFLRAVGRLPRLSILVYPAKGTRVYLPVEVTDPLVEALRTAAEIGARTAFVEPDLGEGPSYRQAFPDSYAATRLGLDAYVAACRARPQRLDFHDQRRAEGIAHGSSALLRETSGEVMVVIGLPMLEAVLRALDRPQAQPLALPRREGVALMHLHPESLPEVLTEMPFLQAVYERRRGGLPPEPKSAPHRLTRDYGPFRVIGGAGGEEGESLGAAVDRVARRVGPAEAPLDRQRVLLRLFAEAERRYREATSERLQPWQRRAFGRYSRNLALTAGQLLADLFDLTVAARGVADDNLAHELWELGASFPPQEAPAEIPTARISGESIWEGLRRITLHRRLHRPKLRVKPRGLRARKTEARPGQWLESFDGKGLCSYPPEDIVIEGYGLYLKKKGRSVLAEERSRVEPFTTSLLDGVDVRETIRNWHLAGPGGRPQLYVRELGRVAGEVGSVVVVFDEDREERYPYRMTWLGEHAQESDMAFYATDPMRGIVGPGIMRAEYGGFLLSYPPRRMADVWADRDYESALTKAETLLLAGLDYSLEKIVVYVAARPPRTFMKTVADRWGRRILYVPIGQLSPVTLKRIRVVHILDGHDKRDLAKDYVW
ncbi:MAG TPA: hypothetical protein VGL15_02315 [Vicinamibacteria bacterium]